MNTKTEVANLALRHMGMGKEIADLDTDDSAEGKALRSLFESFMKTVLNGFNWNFATKIINIEPIQCYPNQKWNFSYRYPADCLYVRGFWNGTCGPDDRTNQIVYGFGNDSQGRTIQTNWGPGSALASAQSNMVQPIPYPFPPTNTFTITNGDLVPVLEYTLDWSAINFFPPDFIWGFSLMLAGWVAPSLSQVGLVDMRQKNLQLGATALATAMARDRMEARPPIELIGELSKSRYGGGGIYRNQVGWIAEPANYKP